jgi:hypothetical protein
MLSLSAVSAANFVFSGFLEVLFGLAAPAS